MQKKNKKTKKKETNGKKKTDTLSTKKETKNYVLRLWSDGGDTHDRSFRSTAQLIRAIGHYTTFLFHLFFSFFFDRHIFVARLFWCPGVALLLRFAPCSLFFRFGQSNPQKTNQPTLSPRPRSAQPPPTRNPLEEERNTTTSRIERNTQKNHPKKRKKSHKTKCQRAQCL